MADLSLLTFFLQTATNTTTVFFLLFIACPRHLLGEIRHGYDCCTRSKTGARIVEAAISVCRAVAIGACALPSSSYFNKARLTVTAYNSKYSSSQM